VARNRAKDRITLTTIEFRRRTTGAQHKFPQHNAPRDVRPSPLLTRSELRRLIIDMVG
jgi:hypothetical protein